MVTNWLQKFVDALCNSGFQVARVQNTLNKVSFQFFVALVFLLEAQALHLDSVGAKSRDNDVLAVVEDRIV